MDFGSVAGSVAPAPKAEDEEVARETARESERAADLVRMYSHTLALAAAAEEGGDDWSELRAPRELTWLDSVYEALGVPLDDDAEARAPVVDEDAAAEKAAENTKHWTNYNIAESLAPSLISEEEYAAACKIGNLIRTFNARRAAARRRIGGEARTTGVCLPSPVAFIPTPPPPPARESNRSRSWSARRPRSSASGAGTAGGW